MPNNENTQCCEQFKTVIGGQALIEGIMMRGPDKDAIVVRSNGELKVEVTPRKVRDKKSVATWPLIRGAVNFSVDGMTVRRCSFTDTFGTAPQCGPFSGGHGGGRTL